MATGAGIRPAGFPDIRAPLAKDAFISCMALVGLDPDGVYGAVLRQGPPPAELSLPDGPCAMSEKSPGTESGAPVPRVTELLRIAREPGESSAGWKIS